MTEFRKVHQFNAFVACAPVQYAFAEYMRDPAPYLELAAFYQAKRDLFRAGIAASRFTLMPSRGTFFQCVGYDGISDERDTDDPRTPGRLDSGVGVLRRTALREGAAVLLRQEQRDTHARGRDPVPHLTASLPGA
jgi:hypothetical protein